MTDPIRAIDQRQRREILSLYRVFADAVTNAVDRLPGERDRPITEADRVAIMREVDDALRVLWGADGAIAGIVTRDTRAARSVPLSAALRVWRKAMGRALAARVDAEAKR